MDIGADTIREWHVHGNGWNDIGYHYVIRRDGTVERGRPVEVAGAHTKGENLTSIGICLIGGRGHNGKPEVNYTAAQWRALHDTVVRLRARFGIKAGKVYGHNDFSSKACPCFNVRTWAYGLCGNG